MALDNEPVHLPTRKIEALLAFLVLHPEPHAREKLAALFWGEIPDNQARVSRRYALARLRESLGGEVLVANRETVQLNASHDRSRASMASRVWRNTCKRAAGSPWAAAGSGKLQWMRSARPGKTGQASAASSHTVIT